MFVQGNHHVTLGAGPPHAALATPTSPRHVICDEASGVRSVGELGGADAVENDMHQRQEHCFGSCTHKQGGDAGCHRPGGASQSRSTAPWICASHHARRAQHTRKGKNNDGGWRQLVGWVGVFPPSHQSAVASCNVSQSQRAQVCCVLHNLDKLSAGQCTLTLQCPVFQYCHRQRDSCVALPFSRMKM